MRKSQASESSKPTPKQKPRLAAITGLEQRAGAAMFQASFDTFSGRASMKPLMLPPLEKCSPIARSTMMRTREFSSSALEHQPKLVALRHRDDVERRPVEDDVGALARGIDLDAEAVERGEAGIVEVGGELMRRFLVSAERFVPVRIRRPPACGATACRPAISGWSRRRHSGAAA